MGGSAVREMGQSAWLSTSETPYREERGRVNARGQKLAVTTSRLRQKLCAHAGISLVCTSWKQKHTEEDAQKGQISHPPNPGAPRRAVPRARPQRAKRRGGTYRTSCGPFALQMDLGEQISRSSVCDLRITLFALSL